ncbi:MAG: ROK family transcriptional regulator [Propionibacteriaceae bacterium]|nr:ROK family transcriptional regulator [Propionibacteriaceae bacterium]
MTRPPRHPRLASTQTMVRAGQRSLRDHNLCLVFSLIASAPAESPRSRADLAEMTGLTKATVSSLVTDLRTAGLLSELDPVTPHRVGRPAVPLVVAEGTVASLGMEINVDFLGIRALDLTGAVLAESFETRNLPHTEPDVAFLVLVRQVYDVVLRLMNDSVRLIGACLALPGIADHPYGPLRLAPNLGWRDVDVPQGMETALDALSQELGDEANPGVLSAVRSLLTDDLRVENEANLAARTEINKHRDTSFIYVSGEIGIGAAIVVDGHVFSGLHGWAGEIGHLVVDPHGPVCACGATGCLETYAGKRAFMAAAGLEPDGCVHLLVEACQREDPTAIAAIEQVSESLGIALANCINIVDVNRIVLGGNFAPLADLLRPGLMVQIRSRVLASRLVSEEFQISASTTGPHAGATGSALAVLDQAVADPTSRLWKV